MDAGGLLIFCAILLTGFPGNTIILAAYAIKAQKKSTDILIMIQSLVDLIGCITPQPEMIRGAAICWISLIVRLTTSLGSVFLTFAIAVDRYITVCRPFGRHMTKLQAFVFATACLAFSFLINLTILWYYKIIDTQSLGCIFSRETSKLAMSMNVVQIVAFCFAVVVIMYSYAKIFLLIRRQARVRSEMDAGLTTQTGANTSSGMATTSESGSESVRRSEQARKDNIRKDNFPTSDRQSSLIDDNDAVQNRGYLAVPSSSLAEPSSRRHTKTNPSDGNPAERNVSLSSGLQIAVTHSSGSAVASRSQHADTHSRPPGRVRGDKTTRMLLVITVVLILSWLPYIVIISLPVEGYIFLVTRITSQQVVYSLTRIRGFNHMINAFVYWAVNPVFRQDVKQVFINLRNLTNR